MAKILKAKGFFALTAHPTILEYPLKLYLLEKTLAIPIPLQLAKDRRYYLSREPVKDPSKLYCIFVEMAKRELRTLYSSVVFIDQNTVLLAIQYDLPSFIVEKLVHPAILPFIIRIYGFNISRIEDIKTQVISMLKPIELYSIARVSLNYRYGKYRRYNEFNSDDLSLSLIPLIPVSYEETDIANNIPEDSTIKHYIRFMNMMYTIFSPYILVGNK